MEFIKTIFKIKGEPKDWRRFGLMMGSLFFVLAMVLFLKQGWRAVNFFIIAIFFWLPALVKPKILFYLYRIWMALAVVLSWAMTRVILLFLYVVIMTPLGWLLRQTGYPFSGIVNKRSKTSYWLPHAGKRPAEDYEHLY